MDDVDMDLDCNQKLFFFFFLIFFSDLGTLYR